jgi:hypothetical protein
MNAVDILRARAEARAILWRAGEYTKQEAVDLLWVDGEAIGIAPTELQEILSDAFGEPRE